MAERVDDTRQEFVATHRFARISPRKVRYVIDLVRGLPVEKALQDLRFCLKRGAPMVTKVVRSALANATQIAGLEASRLFISKAIVDGGPTFKRWKPRAMGRAYPRLRRTCHIQVALSEMPEGKASAGRRGGRKKQEKEPAAEKA